jgi:type IV secretory pathway protease TraF
MCKPVLFPMLIGLFFLAGSIWLIVDPIVIWNRTESVPKGLYIVHEAPLERGRLVVYRPTEEENVWLAERGITPGTWPLIKRVAGLEGDEICWRDDRVLVNTSLVAHRVEGVRFAALEGCRTIGRNGVFLLNLHPRSVDGRYFGIQGLSRVTGVAEPIWLTSNVESGVNSGDGRELRVERSRRARFKARLTEPVNPLSAHRFFCAEGFEWSEILSHGLINPAQTGCAAPP